MKNKRTFLAALLCGLLAFSLAACGNSAQPSGSSSEQPLQSSSEGTLAHPTVEPGKLLAFGDVKLEDVLSPLALGTQEELNRWKELLRSGQVITIDIANMRETEAPLSAQQATAVFEILLEAEPTFFDAIGNPMTGGSIQVLGYDAEGSTLFHVIYDGEWFLVALPGEDSTYLFSGAGTALDGLQEVLA